MPELVGDGMVDPGHLRRPATTPPAALGGEASAWGTRPVRDPLEDTAHGATCSRPDPPTDEAERGVGAVKAHQFPALPGVGRTRMARRSARRARAFEPLPTVDAGRSMLVGRANARFGLPVLDS